MQAKRQTVNTLLISDSGERASLIQREMERTNIAGFIHHIPPGKRAESRIRSLCADCSDRRPDIVLFDFIDARPSIQRLLSAIGFGKRRLRVPVVALTSEESEDILQSGKIDGGKAIMFAPIQLREFIRKLSDGRRKKFLWSLSVIYDFGPILLRSEECDELNQSTILAQAS